MAWDVVSACAGLVAGVETLVEPFPFPLPPPTLPFPLTPPAFPWRCVQPRNIGFPFGDTPQLKGLNGRP